MSSEKNLKMIQKSPQKQNTLRKEIIQFMQNQEDDKYKYINKEEKHGYFKNLLYQSHSQKLQKDKKDHERKYKQQSWGNEQKIQNTSQNNYSSQFQNKYSKVEQEQKSSLKSYSNDCKKQEKDQQDIQIQLNQKIESSQKFYQIKNENDQSYFEENQLEKKVFSKNLLKQCQQNFSQSSSQCSNNQQQIDQLNDNFQSIEISEVKLEKQHENLIQKQEDDNMSNLFDMDDLLQEEISKSKEKQTKDSYETQEDLSFEKQNENLLQALSKKQKPFKIIQIPRKKCFTKIEPKIIQKKVKIEGKISDDIPIRIIRCFQINNQIYFEIEWKRRISGLQPEPSYINFDEFKKYEAFHLIDFLTSQIYYVDYNGSEKQINISKAKKDYLTINQQNFRPEKILKIYKTNYGPTFEIEWKKLHNTKPEPSLVYYQSLKEAYPDFLLDFYRSKIILD